MQAVILAAGRGSRMGSLTDSLPKPMLEVAGKTLLEHKFDAVPAAVDEIILIVGYLGSVIHDRYGGFYGDKRILYVEQENPKGGTADALWQAKDILEDQYLVMMGDDIYSPEDIQSCIDAGDWSMLVQKTDRIAGGGVQIDAHHRITGIVENSSGAGFAGTNLFFLDTRLFDHPPVPKAEGSSELGLPQTVVAASKQFHIPFHAVLATQWIQITAAEDLERAETILQREQ